MTACSKCAILAAALAGCAVVCTVTRADAETREIDFARDVRPILADNCFACHGPDDSHREADLRLDKWEPSDDYFAAADVVVPGDPEASELFVRVSDEDEFVIMPPADSGKSLTPDEIQSLRDWIATGAEYRQHWAFEAPQRPTTPDVKRPGWVRNPIDAFVLARLEPAQLAPSPPAGPTTLLRRLSLDLIGLPPTPEEVDAFLADVESQGLHEAYEREVDRLLSSPHYGERWGRIWLDNARYADSDGYEKDKPREVWMYRDWVIKALNDDMPFDQFIIEQIAGDMLPDATQDQLVATGFLRNSMTNMEGGIDPEEFRMATMFDRVDAVGKAVLGLTIQCAQCHNHKYDPLTHAEYFQLFAFLNNCHEAQITGYSDEEQAERQRLLGEITDIEHELRAADPDWPGRMTAWEAAVREDQPVWVLVRPEIDGSGGQKHLLLDDGSILAAGYAPSQHTTKFTADVTLPKVTAIRLEVLNDHSLPHGGPGRSVFGQFALTEFRATASHGDQPDDGSELKFASATADVNPPRQPLDDVFHDPKRTERVTGPIEMAIDGDDMTAWGIDIGHGRSNVPRKAVFVLAEPLEAAAGVRITFKLDQKHGDTLDHDLVNNNLGRFRFAVTSTDGATADPLPAAVRGVLEVPPAERTPEQLATLFSYWRTTVPEWADANRRIEQLWQRHPRGTSQLVVLERDEPRKTHRLERGDFLQLAEEVSPGAPEFLHPLADDEQEPNRLTFARWLADRRSPTTARSIVNRIWQAYFSVGLIDTAEDFGTQGSPPTHPELLDWLAVELMDSGWSLKHLHGLIVTSATYQQSSAVTPELLERDPANELLARGARFRVDAEVVRDIALAASGLLNPTIGGPSVYPPAPQFLFERPASFAPKTWYFDDVPQRYRRALYTFRYRSVPHPALQNFDAPSGETACARRVVSNTPLQALTTLNEPLFLDAARALAARIVDEGGGTEAERIAYAVRLCTSRAPYDDELNILQRFVDRQRERFERGEADPVALLRNGDDATIEVPNGTTPAELAAWTALARVVLNLDETITRE